jgi:hypothetical protein
VKVRPIETKGSHHGPDDSTPEDFTIIGAGPIGIYLAYLLLESGKSVCLVESGSLTEENSLLNRSTYLFKTPSAIPEGAHRFGGGGNLWFRRCGEFLCRDFRPIPGVRDNSWPISKEELDPHYLAVYRDFLNDDRLDNEVIVELLKELPELDLEKLQLRIHRVIESKKIEAITKKVFEHPNLKLLVDAYCHEILPCKKSDANSYVLRLFNSSNVESRRETKKLIIAGGALQSPALILRSGGLLDEFQSTYTPGSYLMEHIEGFIGYLDFKSEFECQSFLEKFQPKRKMDVAEPVTVGVGLALSDTVLDSKSLLTSHLEFFPFRLLPLIEEWEFGFLRQFGFSKLFVLVNNAQSFLFSLYVRIFGINLKKRSVLWVKSEEIPYEESSVNLSLEDLRRITYDHRLAKSSVVNLQKSLKLITPALEQYAVAKLRIRKRVWRNHKSFGLRPNWHPMGTLRIGETANDSFCDRNLQVHGHPDLYVINAAVFPAGSNANPVFTSLALANRFVNFIRLNGGL